MAFCKVMIIGNLGRDPEMRYTPSGRPVTQFTRRGQPAAPKNQQTGEWIEETDWFRVSVFGDRAERAAEKLRKGNRVFVEGRFRTREFEGNDGQKRTSLDLTADNVISLDASGRARTTPAFAGAPPRRAGARRRPLGRRIEPRRPPTTPTSTTFPSDQETRRPMPPTRSRQEARRLLPRSPPPQGLRVLRRQDRRRSTTRRSTASAATCPSAPRSSRAARPAPAPATSASWRSRSSAPGTSPCCPYAPQHLRPEPASLIGRAGPAAAPDPAA